jgi:hypothetical protein
MSDDAAWADLEIDWDRFHPDARTVLNDLFFWDTANDFGPHGNDTGFDTLSIVEEWHADNLESALTADELAWLYEQSGIERKELDWDAYGHTTGRETAVAAAFALIKLRSACPEWLVVRIRDLIENEAASTKKEFPEWPHRAEWMAAMEKTLSALRPFAPKH